MTIAATATLGGVVPTAVAKKPKNCKQAYTARGVKIASSNRTAVYFQTRSGGVYGCLKRARRVVKIDVFNDSLSAKFAGDLMLYSFSGSGKGDSFISLGLVNLRTGKDVTMVDSSGARVPVGISTGLYRDFFLTRGGAVVAFRSTERQPPDYATPTKVSIVVLDGDPRVERVLDTGEIPEKSVQVTGETLTYTVDGVPKQVQLSPSPAALRTTATAATRTSSVSMKPK